MEETSEKKTLPKIEGLPDARDSEGADNLLHTTRIRTRSGHYIEYNDNKEAESVTIQHRTGSMIQMQADGSVRLVSQNGKMGIEVNGEGYMRVTGAYDVIVDGDASLRVNQDYNVHVSGDYNLTVDGTHSVAAKNMALNIEEKYELLSKDAFFTTISNSVFLSGGYTYMGADSKFDLWTPNIMTIIGRGKVDINP